ncbi:hypothetical protein Hanom_Chr04g00371991 [Helianthus anomalus]
MKERRGGNQSSHIQRFGDFDFIERMRELQLVLRMTIGSIDEDKLGTSGTEPVSVLKEPVPKILKSG